MKTNKRSIQKYFGFLILILPLPAFNQDLASAVSSAQGKVAAISPTVTNFMYTASAILAAIAAIRVVSKFANGDPEAKNAAIAWFSAVAFAVIAGYVINSVF